LAILSGNSSQKAASNSADREFSKPVGSTTKADDRQCRTMSAREQQLRQIFAICSEHVVELSNARERTSPSGERCSLFYREKDSSDKLVACYRVWTQQCALAKLRLLIQLLPSTKLQLISFRTSAAWIRAYAHYCPG